MADQGPRFRRDLDAKSLELDGITYVDVADPRSGNVFRFYDFEHAVAETLDGRALDDVVAEARTRSGYDLTTEQLDTFIQKLRELGFLEVGDDDTTHTGPMPGAALDMVSDGPDEPQDEGMPVPAALAGGTEKLPLLDDAGGFVPFGGTDKLVPLDGPTEAGPSATPVSPSPGVEAPAPASALPVEPSRGEESPLEALPVSEPLDNAVTARESREPEPPPEAPATATAALDDDEEPTTIARPRYREPDEGRLRDQSLKGTLFGVPFQSIDEMVAAASLGTDASPTEPVVAGPEPRATPERPKTLEMVVLGPPVPAAVGAGNDSLQSTLEVPTLGPDPIASATFLPSATIETPTLGPELAPAAVLQPPDPSTTPAALEPAPPVAVAEPALTLAPYPPSATPDPEAVIPASALAAAEAPPSEDPGEDLPAPPPAPTSRRSPVLFAAAGVAAAVTIGVFGFRLSSSTQPTPIPVRTIVPTPGSTYRWFEATGMVRAAGERTLTFSSEGKVIKVLGPGSTFHPGDVIAEIQGVPQIKGALEHNRQRLAYYEQRLADMTKENNRPEMRQAELKIAEKKRLIAEAEAGLSHQGVLATTSGEVAEALVTVGATVKAGAPAVRIKGSDWRAEFELSRDDADKVRHMGFCRAEIEGKPLDCSLSAEGGDETHVFIDLPSEVPLVVGKPVRLAKARYDDVFVLPATALAPTKGADRRVYVVKEGRVESYAVVLADQSPSDIVVKQGLDPGSAVVAEVPPSLRPRAIVKAIPAKP